MSRIFLIDFENVSDAGLEGFFLLPVEDRVYVFYTEKAGKIGISFFSGCFAQTEHAALEFVKAQTGNQALDLQLASFLGSLIGEGQAEGTEYYIVSKDKGFGCLPGFWNGRRETPLSVIASIAAVLPKDTPEEPAETVKAEPSATGKPKKASSRRTKKPAAPAAPAEEPKSAEPAVPAEAEKPAGPQPEEDALPSELKDAAPARKLSSRDRSAMNASVQQALSKAKFDNEIVNSVASLISKVNRGSKSKQELYRSIIKTYGQKQGLAIYNVIKPILN